MTLSGRSISDPFVIGSSFVNCDRPKLCTIVDAFAPENDDVRLEDLSVEIEVTYVTERLFNNDNTHIAIRNRNRKFLIMSDLYYA